MSKKDADPESVTSTEEQPTAEKLSPPKCGIVMPISAIDNYTKEHWVEVLEIITEAIADAKFEGSLVSVADDTGIIQKRIIQNLYDNPIVVCDVSGKNPNVMFELGIRLAFDKPTIIVKDDKTDYSFDTAPIEHLTYPRDLRFGAIRAFKNALATKINGTYQQSQKDNDYTTFLKHFGKFSVAKLDTKEVSVDQYILEEVRELRKLVLANARPRTPVRSVLPNAEAVQTRYSRLSPNVHRIIFDTVESYLLKNTESRDFSELYDLIINRLKKNGIELPPDITQSLIFEYIDAFTPKGTTTPVKETTIDM